MKRKYLIAAAALAVVITVSVMLGAALRVWAALFERREGSADA